MNIIGTYFEIISSIMSPNLIHWVKIIWILNAKLPIG